jgi:hypothetical protein
MKTAASVMLGMVILTVFWGAFYLTLLVKSNYKPKEFDPCTKYGLESATKIVNVDKKKQKYIKYICKEV